MRWLLLLGAIGVAAVAAWYLLRRPDTRADSRTLAQLAGAVLSLVLLIAAAYTARWFGIYSLPLVVLAFVPFGVAGRWLLIATRDKRVARESDAPSAGPWARFVLPLLVVAAVVVAVLGVALGTAIGPH